METGALVEKKRNTATGATLDPPADATLQACDAMYLKEEQRETECAQGTSKKPLSTSQQPTLLSTRAECRL